MSFRLTSTKKVKLFKKPPKSAQTKCQYDHTKLVKFNKWLSITYRFTRTHFMGGYEFIHLNIYIYTHTYTHVHMYIYVCTMYIFNGSLSQFSKFQNTRLGSMAILIKRRYLLEVEHKYKCKGTTQ